MNLTIWTNFIDTISTLFTPASLAWVALMTLLVIMIINLLIAGRSGWAWIILLSLAGAGRLVGRFLVATIREVASGHEGTGTWDEEH